jgi:arylsulfate sulfotransferase
MVLSNSSDQWLRGGLVFALLASSGWTMSLDVQPSIPSPAPVGTVVSIKAVVPQDDETGPLWYRYRVRAPGAAEFRTIRDYSPGDALDWAPTASEGKYEIEVSVRDRDSGESVTTTIAYAVESRITDGRPVISPTGNRLVHLYSAPPCVDGGRIRVEFVTGDNFRQFTPWTPCSSTKSSNVYLAGLRAQTKYTVQHTVETADGSTARGPSLDLTTEALDATFPATRPLQKPSEASDSPILLQSNVFSPNIATDLEGNVVWYNTDKNIRYLTRAERGGYIVGIIDNWEADDSGQILRIYDLAGNVVAETNAARINEQLAEMGEAPITSFHHEARVLEGGKILVLAGTERLMTDVQGPGEVDILGDSILVLSPDLQVEWFWDAFDHLNVTRSALLGETCTYGSGGCAVFRLAPVANDWLHGNAIQLTPDGHLLYSARHQDWLIKIDYGNGAGSGGIIWRLGPDGDFQIVSDDPSPWFSHQHDANYETGANSHRIIVHDNGNTRWTQDRGIHSRGQVFEIDEDNRVATLVFNVDLGDYSRALGSAEKLPNGNYHFGLGWTSNNFSQSLEFDPMGNLVTKVEVETQMYRGFRMRSLYSH